MCEHNYNHQDIETIIDEKIEVLYDFTILPSKHCKDAKKVRKILANCTNEIQMDIQLHNLLHGTETLDQFIKRGELKCIN